MKGCLRTLLCLGIVFLGACRSDRRTRDGFGKNSMDVIWIYRAMLNYAQENEGKYPTPKALISRGGIANPRLQMIVVLPVNSAMSIAALKPYLQPKFFPTLPVTDHWGNPILCAVSPDGKHFTIVLTGSDGLVEKHHPFTWPDDSESYRDIVFSDGAFVSAPDLWRGQRDWRHFELDRRPEVHDSSP